ncbi:MAG TPA: beta-ketoacyl synthase N-terminal-like domain-containing protein [Vicinamibacterales bacterium]|jgi:3-oxoacyl-[acyl-carrier-protein] synthase II
MRDRVVITGFGCVSSLGVGTAAFVDGLLAGRSGIAPITSFSTEGCRSHTAALLRDFDPSRFLEPLKLRRVDEVGRLALAACRLAIDDARLPTKTDGVGVVMGTATSGLHSTLSHLRSLTEGGPAAVPALGFSNTVGNAAASLCAIEFGLRGPNITFAQKQASSLAAIAYAARALEDGRISAFLTGGFDDFEEQFFRVHDRLRVLARASTDGGEEASRPFDRRRNGFVLGAGGHVVVLETATSAGARGATVYGEVLGLGTGASESALNGWPADGAGIARTMRAALDEAGLEPAHVDVVFASANSSRGLDHAEASALEAVFGPSAVPVVSLKGAIGEHGAAGAAALTAALLCPRRGQVPPTLGSSEPDPACRVDISVAARPARGPVALINATAAGGSHYTLAVKALPQD